VADEVEGDGAPMRRRAVLDHIDACQVPSTMLPPINGMERLTAVSMALMWLGMSSGPSSWWA
jgi:hypothetical protein